MALQSSGQIRFSELNTELSRTSTDLISLSEASTGTYGAINTNNAVADRPDQSAPHAISEWYSYDHNAAGAYTNTAYYEIERGQALRSTTTSSPFALSGSQDLSVSVWVSKGVTVENEIIWYMANSTSTANIFILQYQNSLNRFVVRHRTNSVRYDRQYAIHDNNSVIGCGTNSATKWSSSNRGNVNADNQCLLTVTYDASQSNSANGLKLYWNATEITTQAVNASGARTSSDVKELTLGNNNHNATTTAGGFSGTLDEFKIYSSVLTPAQVATIYNSGAPANAANTYSTNLITEYSFDTNTRDSAGLFATTVTDSGTRASY